MNSRLAAAGVMAGLFIAGAVTGGAVVHFLDDDQPSVVQRRSDRGPDNDRRRRNPRSFATERVVESLTARLELRDQQRDSLEAILESQRAQASTVFQEMWPRLNATVDSANALFRRVLDPDQQARFDSLLDENRGVLGRPPPPSPGRDSTRR
jgi:hypothetical protein